MIDSSTAATEGPAHPAEPSAGDGAILSHSQPNKGRSSLRRPARHDKCERLGSEDERERVELLPNSKQVLQSSAGCISGPFQRGDSHATGRRGTLYEVPSSDDERVEMDHLTRKRRKVETILEKTKAILVYDDDTLQRHITFETSGDSIQPLRCQENGTVTQDQAYKPNSEKRTPIAAHKPLLGKGRLLSHPRDSLEPKSLPSSPASRRQTAIEQELATTWSLSRKSPAKVNLISQKSDDNLKGEYKRPKQHQDLQLPELTPPPRLGSDNKDSSSPSTHEFQPRTPVKTIKSDKGTTTPRQRELWNMLLKEDLRNESPSCLDLPGLKIIDKPAFRLNGSARHETSTQLQPLIADQRRRLVERLMSPDSNEIQAGTSSDDDRLSDNDNQLNNGQGHAAEAVCNPLKEAPSYDESQGTDVFFEPQDGTFPSAVQLKPLRQNGGLKVTYARQRSYLTEDDLVDDVLFSSTPIDHDVIAVNMPRRRGLNATGPKFSPFQGLAEEMDEADSSHGGKIRSIHELREAGGNARFVSEMEAILDDIDEKAAVPIAFRRSRLLDLVVKLQEPAFCRRFIDYGLEARLLAHLESNADLVMDALVAAALLHLVASPTSTQVLSQMSDPRTVIFLMGLMDKNEELTTSAKHRRINISKMAQMDLRRVCDSLLQSPIIWKTGSPRVITPRILSLQCLESLVRQVRETGSTAEVLPRSSLERIAELLEPAPSHSTFSAAIEIRVAVSILESCTVSNLDLRKVQWKDHTLERVKRLLPRLNVWSEEDTGTLKTLTLRLYLNLTNNDHKLCEVFSTPEVISAISRIIVSHFQYLSQGTIKDREAPLLDNLILSLGSLINLTEWCDNARCLVMSLCDGDMNFLDVFMQLFLTKITRTAEVCVK